MRSSGERDLKMDESVRRNVCRLIAGIVVSDEDLSPEEDAFVDRMLQRFGIPLSERDVIFPIVDATEAAAAMRALDPAVRQEAFGLLLDAAAADGSIAPEELTYLEAVSDVVGVSRDDLGDKLGEALRAAKKK